MSDGPHRTLNMRKGWREVAKRAGNNAYVPDEICQQLPAALGQDWRAEVPAKLVAGLREALGDGRQGGLFVDDRRERIDALRSLAAGFPLGGVLVHCAILVAAEGGQGPAALLEAARSALVDRATCGARQVEEHYLRVARGPAKNIRQKLETPVNSCDFTKLAMQLLGTDPAPIQRHLPKQTSLDDGPRL